MKGEAAAAAEESGNVQRDGVREGGAESLAMRKAVQVVYRKMEAQSSQRNFFLFNE